MMQQKKNPKNGTAEQSRRASKSARAKLGKRVIRLIDKNGYYTTKSVQNPGLVVLIVKNVESEAEKRLESENNLKDQTKFYVTRSTQKERKVC